LAPSPTYGGLARLAGNGDQDVREAVVVERTVHDRGQPDGGGPHAAFGESHHEVLCVDPRAAAARSDVGLGAWPPGDAREGEHGRAGGRNERLARPLERRGDRLDGGQVGGNRGRGVTGPHQVMLESEVDDAVGRPGGHPQPVKII
jgi:hypothetical protein